MVTDVGKVLALVAVAVLVGCGGRISGGGQDSGGRPQGGDDEASTGGDDEGGDEFYVCPSAAPVPGQSCPYTAGPTITVCIYRPGGACVAVLCDPTGHWKSSAQGC
jgi:hypothetical protein